MGVAWRAHSPQKVYQVNSRLQSLLLRQAGALWSCPGRLRPRRETALEPCRKKQGKQARLGWRRCSETQACPGVHHRHRPGALLLARCPQVARVATCTSPGHTQRQRGNMGVNGFYQRFNQADGSAIMRRQIDSQTESVSAQKGSFN